MTVENTEKKKESLLDRFKKFSDVLGSIPKAVTGILLVLSLLSGAYGSFFKVEENARETFRILAPDVDLALEQSDNNAAMLADLRVEIEVLKKEKIMLQQLLVGLLTAQGKYSPSAKASPKAIELPPPAPPKIDNDVPPQSNAPNVKRRERQIPSWKKK